MFIKPTGHNDTQFKNPKLLDDNYWDYLVKEFSDVFKDELPGLPPDRCIHHIIDTGNAKPVSRSPYKMSPLE